MLKGGATVTLSHLAREYGVKTIHCSKTFDPVIEDFDCELFAHLVDQHIALERHNATLLAEPNRLKTKSDTSFKVFTPFARAMVDAGFATVDKMPAHSTHAWPRPAHWPKSLDIKDLQLSDTHTRSDKDWALGFDVFTPGEYAAQAALRHFIDHGLSDYANGRDRPDLDATSRLSPHLRFGEISPQRVLQDIHAAARHDHRLRAGAAKFRNELIWRDFSYNLLHQQPRLDHINFRREFDDFPWRDDDKGFRAWTRGETGYPLVDAGMRQLWQTGWMHNRVRMVAASFLVKHLLIDWRRGEQWFWDCLVDADPANNTAQWQWVAGSGADAAPFFRIFNPITQAEKFDPDGAYRTKFIPGYTHPTGKTAHRRNQDDLFDSAGKGVENTTYPQSPIVAHDMARQRALDAFKDMRNHRSDDHDDDAD